MAEACIGSISAARIATYMPSKAVKKHIIEKRRASMARSLNSLMSVTAPNADYEFIVFAVYMVNKMEIAKGGILVQSGIGNIPLFVLARHGFDRLDEVA